MAGTVTDGRMRVGVVLPIADENDAGDRHSRTLPSARSRSRRRRPASTSAWVFDHLLFRSGGETSGIHECWTILAAIAEATERVELGSLVMCTAFRNAALLAKMAAALDEVSAGRLILGIGAGWHDPEFEAFGYPTDHKVGRFEEALAVITGADPPGPGGPGRPIRDRAGRGPGDHRSGPTSDPRRVQGPADDGAGRASCGCLECRLVRAAG